MKKEFKVGQGSYERAKKRVDDIKGFYSHLTAYFVVNLILLLIRDDFRFVAIDNTVFDGLNTLEWIDWNVYGTPIIWGVFLLLHGISVFGKIPFLTRAWEERQIAKYMSEQQEEQKYK